ncbi:MAG: ABC transporter ATP-binding protein, partial [Treponema sp.]|nr:ABC transporter ATP-binding protein [Treponema sp.]
IKHAAETKTVLLSTHLMQEVQALCTKIYIISDGKISAEGTAEQIMNCTNTASIEDAFLKITGATDEKLS